MNAKCFCFSFKFYVRAEFFSKKDKDINFKETSTIFLGIEEKEYNECLN